MVLILKEENIAKSQVSINHFYFELSFKPNVDIMGIKVYMCKPREIETIFTYNDVMSIQYFIGNGFGFQIRAFSVGVNAYFDPRRTNGLHETPNYGTGKSKFEIDYCRQTLFPRKTGSCARNVGESSSRSNVFLKYFNYNYMEFVGYDTCDKLIWTSGEGIIITNRIRKQGIPKTHINKISPS